MELTEAAQRIVRHHWVLIAVLVLAGLTLPLALNARQKDSFVATSRLDIAAGDTKDADEAAALADTALGIVTSPGRVEAALGAAKVKRNAQNAAENRIKVRSIGTSGILELSVSDSEPKAAAAITNALSTDLVRLRLDAVTGETQQLLGGVDDQLKAITAQLRDLEAKLTVSPEDAGLRLQHDQASTRAAGFEGQRQELIGTLAATRKPTVIDAAEVPNNPTSSGLLAKMTVGGILGLVLGLAAASVLEALRPTIVGPDALARTLGAPVLGRLPEAPQNASTLGDRWLPYYVSLAASGADVKVARLVSVGPAVDLPRLAGWLRDRVDPFLEVEVVDPRPPAQRLARWLREGAPDPYVDVEVIDPPAPPARSVAVGRQEGTALAYEDDRNWTGIVVVAPYVLARDDLNVLQHQLAITQRPVLGVVAYKHRRFGRRASPMPDLSSAQPAERPSSRAVVPAAPGSWSKARNPAGQPPNPPS